VVGPLLEIPFNCDTVGRELLFIGFVKFEISGNGSRLTKTNFVLGFNSLARLLSETA